MPISGRPAQVARIALRAAAGHGFALGGGNALLAYGVITRPTQDVDLFTDQEHGVDAAAGAVEAALRDAGFEAERRDQAAGLADLFPGMGQGLAEWLVTAPDGAQMVLQLAYFDRGREPVTTDIGSVLDFEDVAGGKVCAPPARTRTRTAGVLELTAAAVAKMCSTGPAELILERHAGRIPVPLRGVHRPVAARPWRSHLVKFAVGARSSGP